MSHRAHARALCLSSQPLGSERLAAGKATSNFAHRGENVRTAVARYLYPITI